MKLDVSQITTIDKSESIVEKQENYNMEIQSIRAIGIAKGICGILVIICLITGILYMIKSKKTKLKKILIGIIIIVIPFIIMWILNVIQFRMLLNI